MTHLLNKTTTEAMITETLKKTTGTDAKHALMIIDIDYFKSVNDILGHKVGDHVICVIAGVISSVVGTSDIPGRFGGDEFVVMLRNIKSEVEAEEIAARMVDIIKKKENLTIPETISISIGMAFSETERSCAELFSKADEALYTSKKAGKGCYSVYGKEYNVEAKQHNKVLVWSDSRNVVSTLEYQLPHIVYLDTVTSTDDIKQHFNNEGDGVVIAIYVDVSDYADDGKELWNTLKKEDWIGKCPIIAICKEGNINQIRLAVTSGIIVDLMLSPVEVPALKRRITEYLAYFNKKQEEKNE